MPDRIPSDGATLGARMPIRPYIDERRQRVVLPRHPPEVPGLSGRHVLVLSTCPSGCKEHERGRRVRPHGAIPFWLLVPLADCCAIDPLLPQDRFRRRVDELPVLEDHVQFGSMERNEATALHLRTHILRTFSVSIEPPWR